MSTKLASGEYKVDIPDPPGGVRTDFQHWPVAIISPPNKPMSDSDYRAYLEWSRSYIVCTGQIYTMVLDARNVPAITPTQRKILSEHMASTRDFSSKYCAGIAMVYDSIVMRGVMTAIFWMTSPAYPTTVTATPAEAVAWCKTQLGNFRVQKSGT